MEKPIEQYEYAELSSLGWELIPENKTSAVWECWDNDTFGHPMIEEIIPKTFIGEIYYQLLFEAFITTT